ncbi:MAG TPA: hypothetical protein DEF12_01770 [Rhodobacteraceae bacterium]|jgi:flagellar biosynthesis regulator FlaF|nr:hypothetical protein [Paracoccaceae bacterium]
MAMTEDKKAKKTKAQAEGAVAKPSKKQKVADRLASANKISFTLETEVRKLAQEEAKKSGMELGHFMQKLVENFVLENAAPDNELAKRLKAKRAVIERAVNLAQEIDQKGGFDEHLILNVMKTATQDGDFAKLYALACGNVANDDGAPASKLSIVLNQQLGRMIKKAVGARSKRNDAGKIARVQVSGEAISTYTLLEKAS